LDIAQGVAKLIALIVIGAIFVPPIRQMLLGLGVFVVGAGFLAVVVGLGVVLIRRSEKKPLFDATPLTTFNTTLPPPATLPEHKPQTAAALIEQLRSIDWFQFEQLVALVYRKQGYSVSRRGGVNPDGGIDLVIEKTGKRTAIQCKHWKTWNVGVKAVREFLGALTDSGIQRGLFITLGGCTGDAKQLADKHGIEVVDETGLARMLEATHARFDPDAMEILHDTRKLCPKCKREMLLRTASKGRGAGQKFWGCPAYPRCRFTMPPSNSEPRAELTAVR
jgi:HJR/Mrr/RecB family endonuclease